MTVIIDYGIGNIFNVLSAIRKIDPTAILTKDLKLIQTASRIILPGVGAFKDAIDALKENALDQRLIEAAQKGVPILGICLGMQLLYEESNENGSYKGLGLLKGRIERFDAQSVRIIPHMGWNALLQNEGSPFETIQGHVYFVHSYYAHAPSDEVYAYATYESVKVPAIVGKNNIYGMQFHPEKSSSTGFKLLEKFYELTQL